MKKLEMKVSRQGNVKGFTTRPVKGAGAGGGGHILLVEGGALIFVS